MKYINKLKKIIPTGSVNKINTDLQNKYTEWRWRLFNINDKYYLEISFKLIDSNTRIYITSKNTWEKRTISDEYNKFIIGEYYYYGNKK